MRTAKSSQRRCSPAGRCSLAAIPTVRPRGMTELVDARDLNERAASPYALATALALAWSRNPGALEYFAPVHAERLR